jgi:transcription elongation factor GreA
MCNSGGTVDFIHPDLFQGEFFFRREITMIIKLKDGSVKEYSAPVTAAEITKDISMGLYRNACCVSINGKIADLRTVVESDCDFEVLTFDDEDGKKAFNHTASHVMAQAVKRLYPNAKLTIGPAIENGFYYDFDVDTHFTQDDLDKIEKELEFLRTEKRTEIAERIKVALGFGDLSENSEYDEAKNAQAENEGKIAELENKIRHAKIIDEAEIDTKTVQIGNTVKLYDVEFEEEVEYTIVGSTEVNLAENKISNESPIGKALLGAKKGSTVEVNAPAGVIKYQILSITK